MKKKGFTLVEVIAAIFIIAVLTTLLFPVIMNQINGKRLEISDVQKEIIYDATELYIKENEQYYQSTTVGEKYCVKLETLIEDKKLKKPLVDASTKKEIPLNNSVRITVEANNNYSYEIVGNKNCENMYTDITPPIATIDYESYTDRIKVEAVCSDIETGIKKYEFSKDNGKTWIDQGETNNYTFKNLTESSVYKIKIRCTNGKGMRNVSSKQISTKSISNPAIKQKSQNPENTEYAQSRKIQIIYNIENVKEPEYYYKSTVKVTSNEEVYKCGNGDDPDFNNCESETTKELETGYWYKGKNKEPIVEYKENGTLYALLYDGTNISGTSTWTVTKIDTTGPKAQISILSEESSRVTVVAICNDEESGASEYNFYKDGELDKTYESEEEVYSHTYEKLTHDKEYTFKVECKNGSGITGEKSITGTTTKIETPTYSVSPSGWAQSKTVTIDYKDTENRYTHEYSVDGGITWKKYTGYLKFTNSGTVIAQITDGTNYVKGSSQTVSQVDPTAPTSSIFTYTKTSKSITVTASGEDKESGIVRYQFSKDGGATWTEEQTSNKYTFSNLKTGIYEVKVRVINGTYVNGKEGSYLDSETKSITTVSLPVPTYTITQTPSDTEYAQSKTITINYHDEENLYTHEYSVDGGLTWNEYTGPITFTENTTIIAQITDDVNYILGSSQTINKIDTSAPTLTLGTLDKSTSRITIPYTATDSGSGITSTVCEYGESTSYGKSVTGSNGSCVITSLTKNKTYYYRVTTTNGSGLTATKTGNTKTGTDGITFTVTQTPSDTEYGQSKNVVIKYTSTNITNPTYYFMSTVGVTSSISVSACGTGSTPSTCSGTTTSITANTWYKVASNPTLTVKTNGTITAVIHDGDKYLTSSGQTINKIDTSAPTLTLGTLDKSTSRITIPYTATDSQSGITSTICEYGTSTSYGKSVTGSNGNCVITGLDENKTYYFKVTTTNGSGLTTSKTWNTKTGYPNIAYTVTPEGWATSKTIKIEYTSTDITNPTYYFMSTVGVTSSVSASACGTGSTPSTCSGSTTSITANTWYKVASNPTLTVKTNGTITAVIHDGDKYLTSVNQTVAQIDRKAPECEITVSGYTLKTITIKAACTDDGSGIKNYGYSIGGGDYTTSTTNTHTFNSLKISTIKVKVTDNVSNSEEYVLSETEKNRVYNLLYELIESKYNEVNNNKFLYVYPVGSIYITTASDENTAAKVASKYGGTWEAYGTNRVLRGTTGTAGSTGGNSSVTLTSSQIPSISTSGTVAAQSVTTASTGSGYTISYNTTGTNNATSGTTGIGYSIGYGSSSRQTNTTGAHTHKVKISNQITTGTKYARIHGGSSVNTSNPATPSGGAHTHTVADYYANSISGVAAHTHTYTNRYATGISGVQAHTHTLTVPSQTITSSYTNSSQSTVSVLDSYITVYMYKRTA